MINWKPLLDKGVILMNNISHLSDISEGETAVVTELLISGGIRRRLQDIGLIRGTPVSCFLRGTAGDISAFLIRGAVIALRREDSERVIVRKC